VVATGLGVVAFVIVTVNCCGAVWIGLPVPVAWTVNVAVPALVGVPAITPV
jgi:hypothetical protein